MPIIEGKFKPHRRIFANPQVSTIYASLLRHIPRVKFDRERLECDDGDFMDLDWSRVGSKKVAIILSGLEGKSNSLYSRAAIRHFNEQGWDVLGLNYRGCSGVPNRLLSGYHMGVSDDVRIVVDHILERCAYDSIVLLGYSLGGNIALKYLGEQGNKLPPQVKGSVSFSVPIYIEESNRRLTKWYNWHYLKWFMFPLNWKANRKKRQYPNELKNYRGFFMSGDFLYFDKHFTAPANGFSSVQEYWQEASCAPHLDSITVPSLVVDSLDDTFISKQCYPYAAAEHNPNLHLEICNHGGHCGFIRKWREKIWWMEERAFQFLQEHGIAE